MRTSSSETLKAAAQLVLKSSSALKLAGFQLADVVAFGPNFDGIVVEGIPAPGVTQKSDALVSKVRSAIAPIVAVPVEVRLGISIMPALGRGNDYSPFNAGGLMSSQQEQGICSSGFSVRLADSSTHTTTARHCTASDYVAVDNSSSNYVAGSTTPTPDGGARVLGGSGSALTWDGTYDQQDYTKRVTDFGDVSAGDLACSDGANSGAHCYLQVTETDIYFDDDYGPLSGIRAEASGQIASIQGDSGGPVLFPLSNGGDVLALGILQAISGNLMTGSACGSVRFAGNNQCSVDMIFTSMRAIVNSIGGAQLVTGY